MESRVTEFLVDGEPVRCTSCISKWQRTLCLVLPKRIAPSRKSCAGGARDHSDARGYPTVWAKVTNCPSSSCIVRPSLSYQPHREIRSLSDKAGIDRCVKAPLLGGNVLHALTLSDVDKIERRRPDEVLQTGLRPDIRGQVR